MPEVLILLRAVSHLLTFAFSVSYGFFTALHLFMSLDRA
jgi:hypothetical protein